MKDLIVSILGAAIGRARDSGQLVSTDLSIGVEAPRDAAHGDVASNVALAIAKAERKSPRAVAEIIKAEIVLPPQVSEVSVAGPGFINFRMAPEYWHSEMRRAASGGKEFWKPTGWEIRPGAGRKVQVEFLSANPTGPVTVGHGRNAVLGDAIARLYEAARFDVTRDDYVCLRDERIGLLRDAVLVRSGLDRQPTYRTPDIAYHIEKLKRGFDLIVDVFGSDHIGEHQQVVAAVKALGHDVAAIRAIIYQFVTLTRGGEKVKMSTRKATYVTLDELIDEVGVDVVRFFFLFRKSDSQLDFDLELAKKQAPENPVFYVQYAHARLASIFREGEKLGLRLPAELSEINLNLLGAEELDLVRRAVGLPAVMTAAAKTLEPHRIPFYLLELAGEFHRYYNKPTNRIIGPDRELSMARMFMAEILKSAIYGGLELLVVSGPKRM